MKHQSFRAMRMHDFIRYQGLTLTTIALILFAFFHFRDGYNSSSSPSSASSSSPPYWEDSEPFASRTWDQQPIEPGFIFNATEHANLLLMTQSHCQQSFPFLFRDLDRQVRKYRSTRNKIRLDTLSKVWEMETIVQAMIYDQQLYVISAATSDESFAVLSQIHRALLTAPEPVPNIEFAFSVDDQPPPSLPIWASTRAVDDHASWLIPDLEYFSWPETGAGSFHEVRRKVQDVDQTVHWRDKSSKVHWRGATLELPSREDLVNVTSGRTWADVKEVEKYRQGWGPVRGMLSVGEHCKAKYLAHTEGNPYSGRLKYLQLCNSVVISQKLNYETHTTHLMKNDGHEQNYLEVADDWSDLESKVRHLRQWDALGERIAKNNVETFRDRNLTPAAEVCYWRRLFKGWAQSVAFEPQLYAIAEDGSKMDHGIPFESFVLERRLGRRLS